MKKNKFLIYSFLFIIFGVLCYLPIKFILIKLNIASLNYDNFKVAEVKEGNSIFTRVDNKISSIKTNIENRVTNYFPFYSNINYGFSKINYNLNKLFYNDYVFLGTNSNNEYIYTNGESLILRNSVNSKVLDDKFNNQIEFYKELAKENINLYIYLPNRYEFNSFSKELVVRDYSVYFDKIKALNIENIKVDSLDTNDLNEYYKYFYKTDHHWNSYGALKGYQDIVTMMGFTPKEVNVVETKTKFRGSFSKESAITSMYDYFNYLDYETNDIYLVETINKSYEYKPKVIKETNNIFYDYYVGYYNGQFGMVTYKEDNSDRNLLVISDSFVWPVDEIIASHFKNTYIVNVRYDEFINGTLNYKEFVKENNITDVLVLGESESTLFDIYNYDTARKILGE